MSVKYMSKTPTYTKTLQMYAFTFIFTRLRDYTMYLYTIQNIHRNNILLPRILLYTILPLFHSSVFLSTYFTHTHTYIHFFISLLLSTPPHSLAVCLTHSVLLFASTIRFHTIACDASQNIILDDCGLLLLLLYFKTSTLCSLSHSNRVQNSLRRQQCHTHTQHLHRRIDFNQIK